MAAATAQMPAPPQAPHVKVQAFRQFAGQLAAQVTEQLCEEFEREVQAMTSDLVTYRNELTRVAELLAHQLGRERQLHDMLGSMANHHTNLANQASKVPSSSNREALHQMVEQMFGETENIIVAHTQGWSQAASISQNHLENAKQLQDPLISAENELNRIMNMLQTSGIPAAMPAPTQARIPGTPTRPGMTSVASIGAATPPPMSPGMRQGPFGMPGVVQPGGIVQMQAPLSPGPASRMVNGMPPAGMIVTPNASAMAPQMAPQPRIALPPNAFAPAMA